MSSAPVTALAIPIANSASATTRVDASYASLWGKNLTNETVANSKILTVALWGYPIYGSVAPPATYGAEFGIKF